MKFRNQTIFLALFIFTAAWGWTEGNLSLQITPAASVPLTNSGDLFYTGGGGNVSAAYAFGSSGTFSIKGGADFLIIPLASINSILIAAAEGGPVIGIPAGGRLSFSLYGSAGYYYWLPQGWETIDNGGGLKYGGGISANFALSDTMTLALGAGYDYYSGLYNGLRVNIGTAFHLGSGGAQTIEKSPAPSQPQIKTKPETGAQKKTPTAPQPLTQKGTGVELTDFNLKPVFPVLFRYYDNNPVGTALLKNSQSSAINNVKVTFYVERYMDNPMDVGAPTTVEAGSSTTIDIYGLFTEDMLDITEGTKASSKVTIEYTLDGNPFYAEFTPALEFYNRNALTWDDDRKVCAFVTSKDPVVLEFAKNVTGWMKSYENPAVDQNLQKGMALFEAVKAFGIRYEIDPATPFTEFSEGSGTVDFLQFPRQTLNYTAGDCDDLSVLFSSLLEAVGVETAFITIPGHIYMAFALKSDPDTARKTFSAPDTLIFKEGKAWVPVEITMFQSNFQDSWQTAAKEWRENNAREQANFYPTREAWKTYQAVGYSGGSTNIDLPSRNTLTANFSETLRKYVDKEIYPQVAKLQGQIQSNSDNIKYKNRLAILYARYGLFDRAKKQFQDIVEAKEYLPALVNLGNIFYMDKEYSKALTTYERAYAVNSQNALVLLGISRANQELENYGTVKRTYEELKKVNPELALKYAYLDLRGDEASRAADASGLSSVLEWADEEVTE